MDDRQRLEAIVSVINKYLPPDGTPINDAMSEIISLVDPLPAPQPAQEPVAWVAEDVCNGQYINGRKRKIWWECDKGVGTAIYTAPPQRTWVGLTIYEMEEAFDESMKVRPKDASNAETIRLFATAIEAKLKEKNT